MRTTIEQPLTFFIAGIPRSGTTIVAAFFNSCDDAFVLGEPHWYIQSGPRPFEALGDCCGKVRRHWDALHCKDCPDNPLAIHEVMDIYPRFIVPLTEAYFHLGGYKETYRGDALGLRLLLRHIPLVDFWVCVMREPADCHRSQLKRGWPADEWTLARARADQEELMEIARWTGAAVVQLCEFQADPLDCVNRALGGRFEITGPAHLQPTGWIFGDLLANKATEVVCTPSD